MNDREKCIKLAEAMGGTYKNGWFQFPGTKWQGFDPFTDERHCHALIKHLNGLDWLVTIHLSEKEHTVQVWSTVHDDWPERLPLVCDNYMHGVCELALKVIE